MLFHHGQFTESPYCVVSVQVLYRGLRESKIGSYNNYMNKNMVICYFTLTFYQTMNPVQADTPYTNKNNKQQHRFIYSSKYLYFHDHYVLTTQCVWSSHAYRPRHLDIDGLMCPTLLVKHFVRTKNIRNPFYFV